MATSGKVPERSSGIPGRSAKTDMITGGIVESL